MRLRQPISRGFCTQLQAVAPPAFFTRAAQGSVRGPKAYRSDNWRSAGEARAGITTGHRSERSTITIATGHRYQSDNWRWAGEAGQRGHVNAPLVLFAVKCGRVCHERAFPWILSTVIRERRSEAAGSSERLRAPDSPSSPPIHAGQCRIGATCRGAAARPHGNQEEPPLTDGTKPAAFTGADSIAGAAITWKYLNAPPSDGAFQWLRFSTLNG